MLWDAAVSVVGAIVFIVLTFFVGPRRRTPREELRVPGDIDPRHR